MDVDKIKNRIRKLQIQSEGEGQIGNSEAAEAFASKAHELLLKYHLSQSDIQMGESVGEQEGIVKAMIDLDHFGIKRLRQRSLWQEELGSLIARSHMCRNLIFERSNDVMFVGTESCVSTAIHIFGTLIPLVEKMSKQEYERFYTALERQCKKDGMWEFRSTYTAEAKGFRSSWLAAFTIRLRERFAENKRKIAESDSTALVVIDRSMERVNEFLKGNTRKVTSQVRRRFSGNEFGRHLGRQAADRVNLGQKQVR